jgi:hypothetical protein
MSWLAIRSQEELALFVEPFRNEFVWLLPLFGVLVDGLDCNVESITFSDSKLGEFGFDSTFEGHIF